jgi:hypothetical protein
MEGGTQLPDEINPIHAKSILYIPIKSSGFRFSRVYKRQGDADSIIALTEQEMEFFAVLAWHFFTRSDEQIGAQEPAFVDLNSLAKLPSFQGRKDLKSIGITASGVVREKLGNRFVISPPEKKTSSWALDPTQVARVEFTHPDQVPGWLDLDVSPNPELPIHLATLGLIYTLIECGQWQSALHQLETWKHPPEYTLEAAFAQAWIFLQTQQYLKVRQILEPFGLQVSQGLISAEYQARYCLMLGRLAWQAPPSDQDFAKEQAHQTLKFASETSAIKGQGYLLLGLIELHNQKNIERFESSTRYFLKALEIFSQGRWWYGLYQSLANFGLTQFLKYQLNQERSSLMLAKDWFERALNVFDAIGIDLPDAAVLIHLALVLFALDPQDLQIAWFLQRALEVSVKLEHPNDQAQAHFELLKISLLKDNVDVAREHRDQILQLSLESDRLTQLNLEMQLLFDGLT